MSSKTLRNLFSYIPGFRSKNPIKIAFASIYYFIVLFVIRDGLATLFPLSIPFIVINLKELTRMAHYYPDASKLEGQNRIALIQRRNGFVAGFCMLIIGILAIPSANQRAIEYTYNKENTVKFNVSSIITASTTSTIDAESQSIDISLSSIETDISSNPNVTNESINDLDKNLLLIENADYADTFSNIDDITPSNNLNLNNSTFQETSNPIESIPVGISYIGNSNTHKFHKSTCGEVKKMNQNNVVEFTSRDSAINAGYVGCKKCNP